MRSPDVPSLFDAPPPASPTAETPAPAPLDPASPVVALRRALRAASAAYYAGVDPLMSDAEYDRQYRALLTLEAADPTLQTPDSPTRVVGAPVSGGAQKHTHLAPMLSLGNAFSIDELDAWHAKATRLGGTFPQGIACEAKIDGNAISLTYQRGVFVRGTTRGDGSVGEDRSAQLQTIRDIPATISTPMRTDRAVEVRGEVYLAFADFERMNTERASAGQSTFANPRNAAAGALMQKDIAETARRPLRFFAYDLVVDGGEPLPGITTQAERLALLREWGFHTAPGFAVAATLAEVHAWATALETTGRGLLPFAIDGAVVKVNHLPTQAEMGATGHEPRWAIARKFAPDIERTVLTDITLSVGRSGTITPNAVLTPVAIGGVMVSAATLHNEDYVRGLDLRAGDTVRVYRAGEVIPKVLGVDLSQRSADSVAWSMPTQCPSCAEPITRLDGESAHVCRNIECRGRQISALTFFASRDAMEIRGLSEKRLEALIGAGHVTHADDLYRLTSDDVAKTSGFARKSADDLVAAIQASRTQPLSRVLVALGLPSVGVASAKTLARHAMTMDGLRTLSIDALTRLPDVGDKTATLIVTALTDPRMARLIDGLLASGVQMQEPAATATHSTLAGCTIVITGTLPTLSRKDAQSLAERHGAHVASSVSKATTFVVAGVDAGSKLTKAQTLNIPILDEAAFLARVAEG